MNTYSFGVNLSLESPDFIREKHYTLIINFIGLRTNWNLLMIGICFIINAKWFGVKSVTGSCWKANSLNGNNFSF